MFARRSISILVLMTAVLLTSSAVVQAQIPSAEAIAASGSFDGKLYTNNQLGFTILAPGGWNFYTTDQNKAVVAKNRETAVKTADNTLQSSAANTQVLFQATPPSLAGQEKSALFSSGIERLVKPTTVDAYIDVNKKLVLSSPNLTLAKDIYRLTFGGVKFAAFEVEGVRTGVKYRQRYIATIRKNVALFFVVTLYDPKQDAIVDFSLQTIKLSK
ncbi:MAG TPA: hypothetical protein PLL77_00255 [Pyrinomonadaceae bacterium]|nr:hypothetical protein [Pyrinomonadaceae bacterium]